VQNLSPEYRVSFYVIFQTRDFSSVLTLNLNSKPFAERNISIAFNFANTGASQDKVKTRRIRPVAVSQPSLCRKALFRGKPATSWWKEHEDREVFASDEDEKAVVKVEAAPS